MCIKNDFYDILNIDLSEYDHGHRQDHAQSSNIEMAKDTFERKIFPLQQI